MDEIKFREIFSHRIYAKENVSYFSYSCDVGELEEDIHATIHYLNSDGYERANEPKDREDTETSSGGRLTISTFQKGKSKVVIRRGSHRESDSVKVFVTSLDEMEENRLKKGIEKIFFGKLYPYENL